MKSLALWLMAVPALLLLATTMTRDAVAEDELSTAALVSSPLESECLELLEKNRLLTARRIVGELLQKMPHSIVGHYVLGRVLHEAEGNLPQAMFHLGKARELFEKRYSPTRRDAKAPWGFHRDLLFSIIKVAGEIEQYEYQLEMIDFYNALHDPDLTAERAWPLMHLGRFAQARKAAREAAGFIDPQQRSLGLNLLCAIEGEAKTRADYFKACHAAFVNARREDEARAGDEVKPSTLAVHAYNAAVAAQAAFLPSEAEELARQGAKLAITPANPYRFLVRLVLDQGRMDDAVTSLRDMQRWRQQQPPHIRDQMRAETDVAFATVLLVAGLPEVGLRSVDMALARPDRRGLTSSTPAQALGAHALLRRALRRTLWQLNAERASYRSVGQRVSAYLATFPGRVADWSDDERIIVASSDDQRLVSTFRVYARGGLEPVPVWLLGDLVEVLGPGVVRAVLREVRDEEDERSPAQVYADAIGAEVALSHGDDARCLKLATLAIEKLPKTEALLIARTAAVGYQAAWRLDKRQQALSLLERAMQIDPGVVRRMGLAIPTKIVVRSSSATAKLVAELLSHSPRLRHLDAEESGFTVAIEGQPPQVRACLRGVHDTLLACSASEENADDASPDDAYAENVAAAFHRAAFAMRVGLTGTDISSLDGSTTVAEQAAREKLQGLLKEMSDDDD